MSFAGYVQDISSTLDKAVLNRQSSQSDHWTSHEPAEGGFFVKLSPLTGRHELESSV